MLTDVELLEMEKRARDATPGPIRITTKLHLTVGENHTRRDLARMNAYEGITEAKANAALFSAARGDVLALIEEVRRLRKA